MALVGQAFQGWRHLAGGEEEEGQRIFDSLSRTLESVDYLFSEALARVQSRAVTAEKAKQTIETEWSELKSQQTADLAVMGELRQELDRFREDLRVRADQQSAQSKEMGKLKSDLDNRGRKARELERTLEAIECQLNEAEKELKIRDQQMNELKTKLASSTRYSDDLVQTLKDQTQADALAQQRLKDHELNAGRLLAEANSQSRLIENLEADREQLRVRIGILETQIEMLLSSTSWRLTAPLRAIKDSLIE